jgi:hypothetical protein
MSGQRHVSAALYPRERPGTHCTGGWVGPRADTDERKISFPPGFGPRIIQPVASRYTDWATRPTISSYEGYNFVTEESTLIKYGRDVETVWMRRLVAGHEHLSINTEQ